MRNWVKTTLMSGVVAFVAIQIIRPARTNPPEEPGRSIHAVVPVDPAVANVLNRSCSDCHSNSTSWPWYSRVAPVSWLIVSDVNRGRHAMNLSDWADYSTSQQSELLHEVCMEAAAGEMPQSTYRLIHRDARLSEGDRQNLCSWAYSTGAAPTQAGE